MTHALARMITYIYEFCGPKIFERLYFGRGSSLNLDTEIESLRLFKEAQKYLKTQGYDESEKVDGFDADGRYLHGE